MTNYSRRVAFLHSSDELFEIISLKKRHITLE